MGFTRQELMEAERQIDSTLRKLQKVFETLRTKEEPCLLYTSRCV